MGPKLIEKVFVYGQGSLIVLIVGILWFLMRPKDSESRFKVREADLQKEPAHKRGRAAASDVLAQAKIKKSQTPLSLPGIRIDGPPHQVLGISPQADEKTIREAYRELMKQYHPDRVGRPGSREWQDAQRIAEALNQAKDELLKKRARS